MISGQRAGSTPRQASHAHPAPRGTAIGTQPPARPGPALAAAPPPARTGHTVTTVEFGRLTRLSAGAVRHACERGEIPGAVRTGRAGKGPWRIPVSSIPTYRKA